MATEAKIRITGEDKTKAAFSSVLRNFDQVQHGSEKLLGMLGRLSIGVLSVAGTFNSFTGVVKMLDQLDDLQEKTGISVEKLSELRYAGEVTGTPFEALASGVGRLSKVMAEAAGGGKEAAATFETLGVAVVDSNGKLRAADDVLADLATRFAGYEDGPAKAALAQRLFGKSGAELIPILNQGAAGLARLAAEAKKLGAVYDGDTARAAAEFNDNLTKLRLSSEGAAVSIAGPLVKALANAGGEFVQAKKEGDALAALLKGAAWFNPSGLLVNLVKIYSSPGEAAAKSTKQIQDYVNALGGLSPGAGRGFLNPKVAAPVVSDDTGKSTTKRDPEAEAKRYLETLQKELEKLQDLGLEHQALRDLELKRLGDVTPALEKQILATARLVDLQKAQEENAKTSEKAAKAASDAATRMTEEAERIRKSVATPFEQLQDTLIDIGRLGESNPLVSSETVARLNAKAWTDYINALDTAGEKAVQLDSFTRHAAENIQNYLGNGLFDILEGNFSNIGKSFTGMINRMMAEAAAANISRWLFGDLIKGGTGSGAAGGLLDQIGRATGLGGGGSLTTGDFSRMDRGQAPAGGNGVLAGLGSWFANLFSFDVGTEYVPRDMVAKIHKGEAIIPAMHNTPGGRGNAGGLHVQNNFTITGSVDRRSQGQIGRAVYAEALRAYKRHN